VQAVEGRSSQELEALFGGEAELQVHSFPHNALLKAQAETQTAQAETQKIKAELELAQDELASFRHLQSLHLFKKEEREKMIKKLGEEKDKANDEIQKANAELQKANAELQKANAELERARKKTRIQREMNLLA
jgi:chromosome segregation ATPase